MTKMVRAVAVTAACFLTAAFYMVGASTSVRAAQDDVRLDPLFERLATAPNPSDAMPIESEIWKIWIEFDEPDVSRNMKLGVYSMNTGQLRQAQAFFDEVIRLAPDFAEGWNKRATVRYLMRNYPASVSDIAQTLHLEPRHFGALSGLGLIELHLGHEEKALKAFERALEIHPYLGTLRFQVDDLREKIRGQKI